MARQQPQQSAARRAPRARPDRFPVPVAAVLALLLLAGCTGNLTTPGEALRILGASLPTAYLSEPYNQTIQAVGGLRPYDFKLADGALPPGLQLQGGAIRGTPSKAGRYVFTLQVSDANLSTTVQKYTLTVTTAPPPTLDFNAPDTQVDRPVTLRVQLSNARQLEGLRTQVRWDAARFELVPDSVKVARAGLAVLDKASKGELQVAVVPLGTRIDGAAELFEFQLRPVAGAAYLTFHAGTEYVSASGHAFNRSGGTPPGATKPNGAASPPAGPGNFPPGAISLPGGATGGTP